MGLGFSWQIETYVSDMPAECEKIFAHGGKIKKIFAHIR